MAIATEEVSPRRRFHRLAMSGRLRVMRESQGLTQADVARALGVNASAVSRWESAELRPRLDRAVALLELQDGDE